MNERRTRWLLVALLVGQLVLLTAQLPDPAESSSLLEGALLRLLAPIGRVIGRSADLVETLSWEVVSRRSLVRENERLREELETLRRESIRSFGLEEDLERLAAALDYTRARSVSAQVADIVYIDHASFLQTLVLYSREGALAYNQPVVSSDGLVGRVVVVSGRYAKAQLITDRSASVGAMIERTRRQGVVRGDGPGRLKLDFVPLQAEVLPGDLVVTAGIDGIYPRGFPVGRVVTVEPGDELFHRIALAPTVDFGLLDQVYVLEQEEVPEDVEEELAVAQP